jgi:glycosyltransferase involved in cell wall biosynthesis
MTLRVLNVAFPFAQLTPDPVGGAEQVLLQIDRALVDAGHHSIVMAAAGSQVCGRLVAIESCHSILQEQSWPQTHACVRRALAHLCATESLDLVHLHGADFDAYLPPAPVPTLVTLHLPIESYPPRALRPQRAGIWFNPVSAAQACRCRALEVALLPPIENGVPLDVFPRRRHRMQFALALGRVCPEKGFHHALDAAALARTPLLLAGAIYPWPEHLRYFEEQITPRLDAARRWIGRIAGARKRRLLAAARCVLIPSRIAETSSLVAMEALAAGTPVIAFRIGALPGIVEHGVTGYIVDDVQEMADAIRMADRLDREACRQSASRRFDVRRTAHEYLDLYRRIGAHELSA